MKKIIYIGFICLFCSCAGFQNASLPVDLPLAQQDSATMNATYPPALSYYDGCLYNQNINISKWQASHDNLILGKKDGALIVNLKDVGTDWEQLTRKFQPLDFSDAQYIIVKAHLDIDSPDSLKLRIDLTDEDGIMTNYSPQEHYIRSRKESKNYKYIYAGRWEQGWPTRAIVNKKRIVEIKLNFNGGGPKYTGKLIIDEIIISDGKAKVTNPNNYSIFDFSDGTAGWWSANSIAVTAEEIDGKDVMKLDLDSVGPGWEGLGYRFDQAIDFSKTPIIKVRMKASQAGKFRIDINDAKDYSTNGSPLLIDFPISEEYIDLFFDYREKFIQSWPNNQIVDSTQIKSIKFHVNPPDNPAYKGIILIDDLNLLSVEEYMNLKK